MGDGSSVAYINVGGEEGYGELLGHGGHGGDEGPPSGSLRHVLGLIINSVYVRLFVVVLILVDTTMLILEFAGVLGDDAAKTSTVVIVSLLSVEVILRIVHLGPAFFASVWNDFDFLVTVVASAVVIVLENVEHGRYLVVLRIMRLLRVLFLALREQRHLPKATQKHVSQRFRRFQKDGFNLDVTYITDNILAMSMPGVGAAVLYRNPVEEVGRFLDHYHGGRYRVYNLCSEPSYPLAMLDNTLSFPIRPNCPPELAKAWQWCVDAAEFLQEEGRLIAVHCDDGTGRTGTLVCCLLLYTGVCSTAEDALARFARKRCVVGGLGAAVGVDGGEREGWRDTLPGVDFPGQRRFVHYFADCVCPPPPAPLLLRSIRLHSAARLTSAFGEGMLWFVVTEGGHVTFDSRYADRRGGSTFKATNIRTDCIELGLMADGHVAPIPIEGDVVITFYYGGLFGRTEEVAFAVYLHTAFVSSTGARFHTLDSKGVLSFPRVEVDHAHLPRMFDRVSAAFAVDLRLEAGVRDAPENEEA